jgi:pimeloyl-ACP methyl ester carboxylesterase
MGGRNVTYCTAHNPERVAALVLVDWSPQTSPEGSKRVRAQNSGLPDAFPSVENAMEYFGKAGASRANAQLRARFEAFLRPVPGGFAINRDVFFRDQSRAAVAGGQSPGLVSDRQKLDMWEALGRVACPTLIIRGTRSDMFAAEIADKVRDANPAFRIEEIDTGHDVAGDDPDGLVRRVRPFIQHAVKEQRP